MLFVDLWQSPILGFTHYETCLNKSSESLLYLLFILSLEDLTSMSKSVELKDNR